MVSLNSRERVIKALNHQEPDQTPIDFGGTASSGISIIAYNKLKKFLSLPGENAKLYDLMQQLADPEYDVLDQMGADVVQLYRYAPRYNIKVEKWKPWVLKDGSQCRVPEEYNPILNKSGDEEIIENNTVIAKMPREGFYYDIVNYPLKNAESIEDIDKAIMNTISVEELKYLKNRAKNLYKKTGYAIVGAFGGSFFEAGMRVFGVEKFLMDLVINKPMLHRWFQKTTESYLDSLKKYLDTIGKYIQVIQFSDDLGSQNSLLISKVLYREMIKSYHTAIFQFVKSHSPHLKVLFHSCGAIYDLIPDLIEAGVDAINPVQISAAGMDPWKLKNEFGRDIVFWGGGANMQYTVNTGTLEKIRDEVKRMMEIFMPDGGFIFTQVHNIQANVSPEKIMAIYETAKKYRGYNL